MKAYVNAAAVADSRPATENAKANPVTNSPGIEVNAKTEVMIAIPSAPPIC